MRASPSSIGDLAHVYADQLLAGVPRRVKAVWDELRIELNVGQYLDVLGTARRDTDHEGARLIARYKSGKYTIERPLHLGAALAGRLDDLQPVAVGLRRSARRGVPAPRRPARRLRRRVGHGQAGRRRPPRGQAHAAARGGHRRRPTPRQARGARRGRPRRPLPGEESRGSRRCSSPPAPWPTIEATIDSLTDVAIAALKTAEVPAEARGALVDLAQFVAWREA